MAQTTNPLNPPVAQQDVLTDGKFSFSWYHWFAAIVAKALNAPVTAAANPFPSNSNGTPGQARYDQNFLYVCVGPNLWKRISLTPY